MEGIGLLYEEPHEPQRKLVYICSMDYDVLVVGGGVSGLYAARLLQEEGFRVHLLEAQERLGGRLHTVESPEGHPIDLGGQWVGVQHDKLLGLCRAYRVPLHATYFKGRHRLITARRTYTYTGTIPRLPFKALISLGWGLHKLRKAAQRLSLQAPWEGIPEGWDEITLAAWRRQHIPDALAREVFDIGLATVLGCEPEEVSFWHTLFYIQSAGSLEALIETDRGAQAYKFTQGAKVLVERLAEGLSYELGCPVRRVMYGPGGVKVEAGEHAYRARSLIVAVPPAVLGRIVWEPPLPPVHQQLSQRMPMGSVTKVVAIYERPFWREGGWSGHFLRTQGAMRLGFDTSPLGGEYGQVTAFGVGPVARRLLYLEPEARQAFYEREMTEVLGQKPKYLYQKSWSEEPWVGGCYVGFFGPGGWRYFGQALYKALPSVYWAGTERSRRWMGYIEGALWAAEAAVDALDRQGE